jgi:hypothetical protein
MNRIAFVTVPFRGHFDYLYSAAKQWKDQGKQVYFIICGWKKFPQPMINTIDAIDHVYIQTNYELKETYSAKFNIERCNALKDKFQDYIDEIGGVDCIIYDFFAIEAAKVAKKKRIYSVCSIPAVVGFKNTSLKNTIKYGKKDREINVSDMFLMPGCENILWHPKEFCGDHVSNFTSVTLSKPSLSKKDELLIYVCLGTVVTGNLWNQNENVKPFVEFLFNAINEFASENESTSDYKSIQFIFSIPHQLKHFKSILKKLSHVTLVENVDQMEILKKASLFITHGGGNSFREALCSKTPMMIIPFFGDQSETSSYVIDKDIGKGYSCKTLQEGDNYFRSRLSTIDEVKEELYVMIEKLPKFQSNFENISECKLFSEFVPNVRLCWKEGDVLFGTNEDRKRFASIYKMEDFFKIGNEEPFHKIFSHTNSLPKIIDQYNDVVRKENISKIKTTNITYLKYIKEYDEYLRKSIEHFPKDISTLSSKMVLFEMCLEGMMFILNKGHTIHFAIGHFDKDKNFATNIELMHIKKYWNLFKNQTIFYIINDNNNISRNDRWIYKMMKRKIKFENISHYYDSLFTIMNSFCNSRKLLFEGRIKSENSMNEKLNNNEDINDIIAFRIVYPWSYDLYLIASDLDKYFEQENIHIFQKRISERGKVIHLYAKENDTNVIFEIQLWTSLLRQCLEYEHDSLYKKSKTEKLSKEAILQSFMIRMKEHELQNILDQNRILNVK